MLIEVSKVEGEENKKEYKVTPKVSVQENKAVTVDVSEYTEPVEILPPEGKVAMEKVTLTLDNIPSGGGAIAYAWSFMSPNGSGVAYFSFDVAPNDYLSEKTLQFSETEIVVLPNILPLNSEYTRNSDLSFSITDGKGTREEITYVYARNASEDINIYEYQFNNGGGGEE